MHCFSCQGSGIDLHRLEVIAQDVLLARDVPILIVPQPSSGLVVVGRLGRGIVPVDVRYHIGLLCVERLVCNRVDDLPDGTVLQFGSVEHDLLRSSAIVAEPILVQFLEGDLHPVRRDTQHRELIGNQLLCPGGLFVQRGCAPGILCKAE